MKITFSLTASSFYKIPHPSSTPLLTDSLLILHHRRLSPLHRRSRSSITPLPQSLSFSFNADEFRYLLHAVFCRCSLKLVSVVAAAATSSSRRRWFSDRYGKLSVNELPSFFSSLFLPYDCLLLWRITFYTLMIKNPDKKETKGEEKVLLHASFYGVDITNVSIDDSYKRLTDGDRNPPKPKMQITKGEEKIPTMHALNKLPYSKLSSKSVGVKDGVVFSTYISLIASSDKGQSRLKQLVQWCGPKFDGLIIFDECHKAKNLMPEAKGGMQPTQTGKAVLDMPEACY
ncbi:hypothetical protein Ahy_B01g056968 isoform B [Arachis hypogaea]|uniref:Strawberry notch AAA domain-containing protein n=1 Tax=Arachis hypogaea TaxID=3818 RepID=A0A445AZX8_ARAHY|nr:hypothetical protein Ahy_B01g056968 isoform B [Arachis hypogaea]